MKTRLTYIIFIVFLLCCKSTAPSKRFRNSLFIASNLTAENLFSKNIEGPAVDKNGNLFVVNYQKDGTIGSVKSDGTCELYVELPEKSTGNSIQFNKDGNMFVADFTGHNILLVDTKTKAVSIFCHNNEFSQPNDI